MYAPMTPTYNNGLSGALPQIIPQLPGNMLGNLAGQFGSALGMGLPYNPSMMSNVPVSQNQLFPQQSGLNSAFYNGMNNPMFGMTPQMSPYYDPSVPPLGAPGTRSAYPSLPYYPSSPYFNATQDTAALDTALSDYFNAKQAAAQTAGPTATLQSVITAGATALQNSPVSQAAFVRGLQNGSINSNSSLAQVFNELKMVGLPSWLTQLPSSNTNSTVLTSLDQQIASLQSNLTTAQGGFANVASLSDYQSVMSNIATLQNQIALLTAQRANAALPQNSYMQPSYGQSPFSGYNLPPWMMQPSYQSAPWSPRYSYQVPSSQQQNPLA